MLYLVIALIIIIIVNSIITKRIISATNCLLAYWAVSVIANKVSKLDFYEVSNKTYLVIFLCLLFFWVGTFYFNIVYRKTHSKISLNSDSISNTEINKKILYIFLVIHIAVGIFFSIRMLAYYNKGYSLGALRGIYQGYIEGEQFFHSQFENRLRGWFYGPLSILFPLIACILLMQKRNGYKAYYLLTLLDTILNYVFTQGRANIFFIALFMLILFYCYKDKLSQKQKIKIIILVTKTSHIKSGARTLKIQYSS